MSFLLQTIPVLILISLLIFNVVCENLSQVGNGDTANVNRNWIKSQRQNTTSWPALGRRNSETITVPYNPTWVRPTQRANFATNTQRPAYSSITSNRRNSNNFNTGNHFGTSDRQQNLNPSTSTTVRDEELKELSETLLNKDVNNAAKYVTINVQKKTTSRSQKDEAPLPLLSVDEQALNIPSIEKMFYLYNNYIVESKEREDYTPQEKNEEITFLDTIINTPVMQHTRDFLIQKGKIGNDIKDFKNILYEIWFDMYARSGRKIGSSGFEHVFLAEIKNNQVSGLHNWLYFNEEEKNRRANYLGYMKKIDLGNKGAILKYHFVFYGIDKPVGSMFVGTSPELEMALYTTCFLTRADAVCPMKLNGHSFVIRTFTYRYKGKNRIGSAFPEI